MDKDRTPAAKSAGNVLQESEVRYGIEYTFSPVEKLGAVQFDGTQDLDALSLAGYGDFRLTPDPGPGRVERRVLSETCFVCEDEGPPLGLGFFFIWG